MRSSKLGKKRGPMSEEHKGKIRAANKGRKPCRRALLLALRCTRARRGPLHPMWRGGYEWKLHCNRQRRALKLNSGGSHSLEQWEALKDKYQHICLCCKKQEPFIVLTEDHIIPLTLGGTDDISNIQPLCRSCNSRKNAKVIDFTQNYVVA